MTDGTDQQTRETDLITQKTIGELLQIRQQRWLEPLKFVVTCVGTILVLFGLWLDREKAREQHASDLNAEIARQRSERAAFRHDWDKITKQAADESAKQEHQHAFEVEQRDRQHRQELSDERRREKVKRMTEIASSLDDLYVRTISALTDHTVRSVALTVYLDALDERLKDRNVSEDVRREIGGEIADFKRELKDSGLPITVHTDGIALQERWAALKEAPTPDFDLYFSSETAEWKDLQGYAWRALRSFNYPADALERKGGDIDEFRVRGARLQQQLRARIYAASIRTAAIAPSN